MFNKINSRMERIEHQQSTMSQSSGTVIPSSKSTIKVNPEVANLYIYSITPLLWRGRMIVNRYTEINKLSMFKSIIKSFSKKVRVPWGTWPHLEEDKICRSTILDHCLGRIKIILNRSTETDLELFNHKLTATLDTTPQQAVSVTQILKLAFRSVDLSY